MAVVVVAVEAVVVAVACGQSVYSSQRYQRIRKSNNITEICRGHVIVTVGNNGPRRAMRKKQVIIIRHPRCW